MSLIEEQKWYFIEIIEYSLPTTGLSSIFYLPLLFKFPCLDLPHDNSLVENGKDANKGVGTVGSSISI